MKHAAFFLAALFAVYSAHLAAVPSNDNFSNAATLLGTSGNISGHNNDASLEPGEPAHYSGATTSNSVWWTWIAPSSTEFTFEVLGTNFGPSIGVYTGTELTNLTRAAEFRSGLTHFKAQQNTTYYIVVASVDGRSGVFTLDFYPDSLSGQIQQNPHNSNSSTIYETYKGAVAYEPYSIEYMDIFRTNKYGNRFSYRYWLFYTTPGLTIIDAKGAYIISNAIPPSISDRFIMLHFDGKQLYAFERDTDTLYLYSIKKNSLQKAGEQVIENVKTIQVIGPYVIVVYEFYDSDTFLPVQGIVAFDRKLKKQVWNSTAIPGEFNSFSDKGIYLHKYFGEYSIQLSLYKKGKRKWQVHIPYKFRKHLGYRVDRKGNTLYWYRSSSYPKFINEPLTLISRIGRKELDHVTLPGAGNIWFNSNFEKNRFFVSPPPSGNTHTVLGYTLGRKIKEMAPATINFVGHMQVYGSAVTIIQYNPIPPSAYGFTQYDINMKKLQWIEPMAVGILRYVDKGVFTRINKVAAGGKTNFHIKIFDKKGAIAEHVIPK